jgi:type VI secretion system secreted protein VgrG
MVSASDAQIRFKLPKRSDVLLHHFHGVEEIGKPFRYELTILSPDGSLAKTDFLGQPMSVELDLPEIPGLRKAGHRYFHGYVTRFARQGRHRSNYVYSASLRPWIWLLSRAKNCRIFQNKSVLEIVKDVFDKHGLKELEERLIEKYPKREYVVQYRESDLDFVTRLMSEAGIFYFHRHEAGRHVLVLADSTNSHHEVPGYEKVLFDPRRHGEFDLVERIGDWHAEQKIRAGAVVLDDYDFKHPRGELGASRIAPNEHANAHFEVYEYPGHHAEQSEGEELARLRLEEINALHDIRTGSGSVRGLSAGCAFTLVPPAQYPGLNYAGSPAAQAGNGDILPPDDFREYVVVSTALDIQGPHLESQAETKDEDWFNCSLTAIDSQHPFRVAVGAKPAILGPQTARVVGKKGEEIWTDPYGRVKVQFHWDREGESDENSSCWVRVAQMWASGRFGAINIPRIGDEVVIEFLNGDPDQPLITGRLYNGDNMPPYELPVNQTQTGIKSRSSKGGNASNFNEIRFEDKKGLEELHMQAEKDMSTLVKHDQSLTVGADRSMTVEGNRSATVKKDDAVTIEGEHHLTVTKAVTETFKDDHTFKVTGQQNIDVEKNKNEHVKLAYTLTTDKAFQLNQEATHLTFEGTNVTLDAAGVVTVKRGGATVSIDKADKVTVSSPSGVSLECGESKIELLPSGIAIAAKAVTASGGASRLALESSGAEVKSEAVIIEAEGVCSVMGKNLLKLNTP